MSNTTEQDPRFPSGPWRGFYSYFADATRCGMDMTFSFADGRLFAEGRDDLGTFVFRGQYDTATGWVEWWKVYTFCSCCGPLGHAIFYQGTATTSGIVGGWEQIEGGYGGPFRLWPGTGSGDLVDTEAKEEPVVPVLDEVSPSS